MSIEVTDIVIGMQFKFQTGEVVSIDDVYDNGDVVLSLLISAKGTAMKPPISVIGPIANLPEFLRKNGAVRIEDAQAPCPVIPFKKRDCTTH